MSSTKCDCWSRSSLLSGRTRMFLTSPLARLGCVRRGERVAGARFRSMDPLARTWALEAQLRCEMGPPCEEFDGSWFCRHGVPRRISQWHPYPGQPLTSLVNSGHLRNLRRYRSLWKFVEAIGTDWWSHAPIGHRAQVSDSPPLVDVSFLAQRALQVGHLQPVVCVCTHRRSVRRGGGFEPGLQESRCRARGHGPQKRLHAAMVHPCGVPPRHGVRITDDHRAVTVTGYPALDVRREVGAPWVRIPTVGQEGVVILSQKSEVGIGHLSARIAPFRL